MKICFLLSFILVLGQINCVIAADDLQALCVKQLSGLPGKVDKQGIETACAGTQMHQACKSVNGQPIFSIEKKGITSKPKNILVFALIHGDEVPSGSLVRDWLTRLVKIEPRNSWRIIPILNPDGLANKTRFNAHKVDLNRNFATRDWNENAVAYWKSSSKSDPRRFPGTSAASEPETQCAIAHLEEFKPNFVVSVHTPYGLLDFDGPKIKFPAYSILPWKMLGNFPGSLGRFMWRDRKVPVFTIELRDNKVLSNPAAVARLQDIIGDLAIGN